MKYQPNSVNVSDFKKNHRVEAPKSSKQDSALSQSKHHLNPKRMLSADESPSSKHFSGIGILDMVSQSQSAANYDILSKEEEDQMMLEIDEISCGGGVDDGNQSGIHSMSNNSIFMLTKSPQTITSKISMGNAPRTNLQAKNAMRRIKSPHMEDFSSTEQFTILDLDAGGKLRAPLLNKDRLMRVTSPQPVMQRRIVDQPRQNSEVKNVFESKMRLKGASSSVVPFHERASIG